MLGGGFNYPTGKKNPITIGFLALLVVGFLMTYFARAAFATPAIYVALESPVWTWVTYPFVFAEFLTIVFSGLWLAFMLAPLEVDKGGPWTLIIIVLSILVFPLLACLVALTGFHPVLLGPMLPLSGITMAWCGANSEAEIRLFLVFPIKGKWLALFEVGLVFFAFGYPHWIQGIAFVLPLALFWFLGTGKIPLPVGRRFFVPKAPLKKTEREFDKYRDEIHRRATEREEKERLRKLFESSLIDDPEDKKDK